MEEEGKRTNRKCTKQKYCIISSVKIKRLKKFINNFIFYAPIAVWAKVIKYVKSSKENEKRRLKNKHIKWREMGVERRGEGSIYGTTNHHLVKSNCGHWLISFWESIKHLVHIYCPFSRRVSLINQSSVRDCSLSNPSNLCSIVYDNCFFGIQHTTRGTRPVRVLDAQEGGRLGVWSSK